MLKLLPILLLAAATCSPTSRESNGTKQFLRWINHSDSAHWTEGCGLEDYAELAEDQLIKIIPENASGENTESREISGNSGSGGSSGSNERGEVGEIGETGESGGAGGSGGFDSGIASMEDAHSTAQNSRTEAPVTTPAAPVTTPAAPVTTPAAPVTTPAAPVTTPAAPVTTPAAPVTTPASPVPSVDLCSWRNLIPGVIIIFVISAFVQWSVAYCFLKSFRLLEEAQAKIIELEKTIEEGVGIIDEAVALDDLTPESKTKMEQVKSRLQQKPHKSEYHDILKWIARLIIVVCTSCHALVAFDVKDLKFDLASLFVIAAGSVGYVGCSTAMYEVYTRLTNKSTNARRVLLCASAFVVFGTSAKLASSSNFASLTEEMDDSFSPLLLTVRIIFVGISMSALCIDYLESEKFSALLLFVFVTVPPFILGYGRFHHPYICSLTFVICSVFAAILNLFPESKAPQLLETAAAATASVAIVRDAAVTDNAASPDAVSSDAADAATSYDDAHRTPTESISSDGE